MKYCTNCQTEFGENHKFCAGCGSPRNSSGHVIQSGDQSVNTIGSEINNSNIHIGDNINNSNNIDPELLNLKREFVNLPWTSDGALAKSSTFKKLGAWGSLASIIGLFIPFFYNQFILHTANCFFILWHLLFNADLKHGASSQKV
ncbi:hypothetical protein [Shewanella scandinavica]|uniref:Zinc ribbon domain-containing protein n=1 Tax=Shewanella scandinavica TaxID=3063538 RepID=A0ABU3G3B2_9GAMM|nr:hypothetical protein [Shewanella sp. SP2S1-2]MDT3281733.1 hypothetical protein [Shewanella sp. SP2S1-2]